MWRPVQQSKSIIIVKQRPAPLTRRCGFDRCSWGERRDEHISNEDYLSLQAEGFDFVVGLVALGCPTQAYLLDEIIGRSYGEWAGKALKAQRLNLVIPKQKD